MKRGFCLRSSPRERAPCDAAMVRVLQADAPTGLPPPRTAAEARAQAEAEGQRPQMTAAEAVAQAKAEGLTLARSLIQESGFRNVSLRPENRTKWCPVLGS